MQLDLLQKELASALEAAGSALGTSSDSDEKSETAFKTISEVAESLDVPQHVLRFWESRFPQIKPLKLRGGRRYYRPADVTVLTTIKYLLYKQGYTIKGAKKAFGQLQQAKPAAPEPRAAKPAAPAVSERKLNQLNVIRQELIGMRDLLKVYV